MAEVPVTASALRRKLTLADSGLTATTDEALPGQPPTHKRAALGTDP